MRDEIIKLELHRAQLAMAQGLTEKAQRHINKAEALLNM